MLLLNTHCILQSNMKFGLSAAHTGFVCVCRNVRKQIVVMHCRICNLPQNKGKSLVAIHIYLRLKRNGPHDARVVVSVALRKTKVQPLRHENANINVKFGYRTADSFQINSNNRSDGSANFCFFFVILIAKGFSVAHKKLAFKLSHSIVYQLSACKIQMRQRIINKYYHQMCIYFASAYAPKFTDRFIWVCVCACARALINFRPVLLWLIFNPSLWFIFCALAHIRNKFSDYLLLVAVQWFDNQLKLSSKQIHTSTAFDMVCMREHAYNRSFINDIKCTYNGIDVNARVHTSSNVLSRSNVFRVSSFCLLIHVKHVRVLLHWNNDDADDDSNRFISCKRND